MLGGNREGTRLARTWKEAVLADDITAGIAELFKQYAKERKEGQAFGDWANEANIWPAPTTQV